MSDNRCLRKHTLAHGKCTLKDRAIKAVKGNDDEVKIDVSDITCEICNVSFTTLEEIIPHLIIEHKLPYDTDVKPNFIHYRLRDLKCLYCEESFNFLSNLIKHVNSCHPTDNFICDECDRRFNKKRDLQAHIRLYHKSEYNCQKCLSSFSSNAELQSHKSNEHASICNICCQAFTSDIKRLKHMKTQHDLSGALECRLCLKISQTKQAFLRHAAKCNRFDSKDLKDLTKTIVVDDAEVKPSLKEVRKHVAYILNACTAIPFKHFMGRFTCFYCPQIFAECETLKQHTVMEHPICDIKAKSMRLKNREEGRIKVDTSSLSCKLCFENMSDIDQLVDHLINEHKAKCDKSVTSVLEAYKLVPDHFACPFCEKAYNYFGTLTKHISQVHSNNRKICLYCGKAFRTEPNLRGHITRHHKAALHKCRLCKMKFSSGSDLLTHLGVKHDMKVYKCRQCSEMVNSRYALQKHLIQAHGTGQKCRSCNTMFRNHSLMMSHYRRVHLKEKNVQCSVCCEKFFDTIRLNRHMIKHVGVRNFHCDICGKKFLWKKNLRGHMVCHIKNGTDFGKSAIPVTSHSSYDVHSTDMKQ